MDAHVHVGNLVGSLTLLEKEDRPGQHAEKVPGDSGVKDINDVVTGPEEIPIDKELVILQSLPRGGRGSGRPRSDKHTLSGESSDLKKTSDNGEEIAKDGHATRYLSLDSQTDESYMDANMAERYFTEVRETNFLDSYEFQPPTSRIDPSQFKIGKQIAEGGQATIHEAHRLGHEDDEKWVLKVFKGAARSSPQGQWPEDNIFLLHPCLCKLDGYVLQSDGSYALLMDRYDGDLRTFIDKRMQSNRFKGQKVPFNDAENITLILSTALGMKALHAHGLTHRDLKTANILINLKKTEPNRMELAQIGDFECSSNVVGTGFWRSPEVLQALKEKKSARVSEIYTPKSDVYSFGMTCYEILTGKIPLDEYPVFQYDVVLSAKKRPKLPEDLHPKWKDLISRCWHQDPDSRPTSAEIVLELKQVAATTNEFNVDNVALFCAWDEGYSGDGSSLEANLNELQAILQVNQTSLSAIGDFVSCANRFLQHFGFGITDDRIVDDEEWWQLLDKAVDLRKKAGLTDNVDAVHLIYKTFGQLFKLLCESVNNRSLRPYNHVIFL